MSKVGALGFNRNLGLFEGILESWQLKALYGVTKDRKLKSNTCSKRCLIPGLYDSITLVVYTGCLYEKPGGLPNDRKLKSNTCRKIEVQTLDKKVFIV